VTPDNQGNALNVNGSRQFHSTFMIDGGFNNDLFRNSGNAAPNPDAVQEFRLITSNFSAEFGRNSGAVFNVVTKSGTNQLHGSVFEFLRNDILNSRNFFQPTVSSLRQNQFGATAGGPIIRNKTFIFGSYQGLRIRNGVFQNTALTRLSLSGPAISRRLPRRSALTIPARASRSPMPSSRRHGSIPWP
jgi:hypothetical protein